MPCYLQCKLWVQNDFDEKINIRFAGEYHTNMELFCPTSDITLPGKESYFPIQLKLNNNEPF